MWVNITDDDKVIYGLEAGELLPVVDIIDGVTIVHTEDISYVDQTDILITLNSINNKRLRIELETFLPFNKLTPIVRKYIDSYYNVNTNEHKEKSEVWNDVLCGE